jgi:hypothetical protein
VEIAVLEAPPSQYRTAIKSRHFVFYITIVDTDKDGIFADGPFFGGETFDQPSADDLARDLVNDKSIPGTVIPKVYAYNANYQSFPDITVLATKQANRMIVDLYDQEEIQDRMSRKR